MKIAVSLAFAVIVLSGIILIPNAFADNVPDWVKNTAGWWATDAISETEFVNAIEYLVKENIIQVDVSQTSETSQGVPSWVKNTAGWWATDTISETEFVNAIAYLIKVGIITLEKECKFEGEEFSHLKFHYQIGSIDEERNATGKFSAIDLLCQNIDLTFIDEFTSAKTSNERKYFSKNSYGFRGPEFSAEKPPNTYRIFLIGGSTMYGVHVGEDATKAVYLQKLFDRQNLDFDVEVINAGMSGLWSKPETNMIKEKIINYEPDLLIVFDGWNDVTGELVKNANWSEEANLENWISRWTEICEIGKQNNFKTIITVQPILGSSNKILSNQEHAELWSHGYIQPHVNLLKNYVGNLKNLESSCTKTADLTNAYADVFFPVYTDLGHVSGLGGEIIAYEFFKLAVPIMFQHDVETQKQLLSDNTSDQLKIRYAQKIEPEKDFSGKLIENVKITGDLKDSRFWFATLRNVDLTNANLVDVDFRYTEMENVNFKGATLQNVLIPRSVLVNVNFSDATLSDVRFSGSLLDKSNFEGAVLDHVETLGSFFLKNNFKNSEIKNTDFKRVKILTADFSTTEFKNVVFESSIFSSADFSDVDFSSIKIKSGVAFSDSLFVGSNFLENELPETDFTQKTFYNCKTLGWKESITRIDDNPIIKNQFDTSGHCFIPGSSLSGLDFSKTDISTVMFSMITHFTDEFGVSEELVEQYRKIYGVNLDSTNFSNSNLSGKNLTLLIFTNANLSHTNLSGADLRYSDLTNANLTAADLTNANLLGADLTDIIIDENTNLKCINHPICESD